MESRLATPHRASRLIECKTALVFALHVDELALGCGGLLCVYKAQRTPVSAVIVAGGHGDTVAFDEENHAATLLEISSLEFWQEPGVGVGVGVGDTNEVKSEVSYNERTIAAAQLAILNAGADLIFAPSISDADPTHRAVAWIVIEASRRLIADGATLRVALYEIGTPLSRVNVLVDITTYQTVKHDAVSRYGSQRRDEMVAALNRFRSCTLPANITSAEAYCLLEGEELSQPVLIAEPEAHRRERLGMASMYGQPHKVSVLIRSMDRNSLRRALDSVALQIWPNIEILVLNARGSGHSPLPDRVGSMPLRFIETGCKVPRSEAANLLMQHADSDYAIFLDDDDWFAPDHISRLVEHLAANATIAAAYSGVEFGQLLTIESSQEHWKVQHQYNSSYDFCRLLFENYLPIHSVLFRLKQTRDDWGCNFDTTMDVFEDWDFWLQLSMHGRFSSTGHVSAFYAHNPIDGSGVASSPDAHRTQMLQLRKKWFAKLSAQHYLELLHYTQNLYRGFALARARIDETEAQISDAQKNADHLKEILSARDIEIVSHQTHVGNLENTLSARNTEISQLKERVQTVQAYAAKSPFAILNRLLRLKRSDK